MTFFINVSQSKHSHLLSHSHHHEIPGNNIRDISSHDQQKTDENDNFVFSHSVCIIQLKLRSLKAFSTLVVSRCCTHTINTNFLPIIIVCFQNEMGIVLDGFIDLFLNLNLKSYICFFFLSSDYFNETLELNLSQMDLL